MYLFKDITYTDEKTKKKKKKKKYPNTPKHQDS